MSSIIDQNIAELEARLDRLAFEESRRLKWMQERADAALARQLSIRLNGGDTWAPPAVDLDDTFDLETEFYSREVSSLKEDD